MSVQSAADTLLVIRGPSGEIACNDDFSDLNPGVFVELSAGLWEVYVGSWQPREPFDYEVFIDPR